MAEYFNGVDECNLCCRPCGKWSNLREGPPNFFLVRETRGVTNPSIFDLCHRPRNPQSIHEHTLQPHPTILLLTDQLHLFCLFPFLFLSFRRAIDIRDDKLWNANKCRGHFDRETCSSWLYCLTVSLFCLLRKTKPSHGVGLRTETEDARRKQKQKL